MQGGNSTHNQGYLWEYFSQNAFSNSTDKETHLKEKLSFRKAGVGTLKGWLNVIKDFWMWRKWECGDTHCAK